MALEIILIILGILTAILGFWNIIIGAFIWGILFLIGGVWSIGLGVLYIIQLKKADKSRAARQKQMELQAQQAPKPIDEGLLTQDLFEVTGTPIDDLSTEIIDEIPDMDTTSFIEVDTYDAPAEDEIPLIDIDLEDGLDKIVLESSESEDTPIPEEGQKTSE